MKEISFNNRLRQVLMIGLILFLVIVFINQLYIFLPGILGGVTLYILTRKLFQQLTQQKKWNKSATAFLFIFCSVIIISIPVYFSVIMIEPKINALINNQQEVLKDVKVFFDKIQSATGIALFTEANTQAISQKISAFIPGLINSTANILTNLIMLFFLLYYLLVSGKEIEKYLNHIIPLKPENSLKILT